MVASLAEATNVGALWKNVLLKIFLRHATLLKKRLQHRCFPVNFAKCLKTTFLQNTTGDRFWSWDVLKDTYAENFTRLVCQRSILVNLQILSFALNKLLHSWFYINWYPRTNLLRSWIIHELGWIWKETERRRLIRVLIIFHTFCYQHCGHCNPILKSVRA